MTIGAILDKEGKVRTGDEKTKGNESVKEDRMKVSEHFHRQSR